MNARGLSKLTASRKAPAMDDSSANENWGLVVVRAVDVQPESVTWLWPGRIARRKLQLAVGDPGVGKSYIALDVTARITTGRNWPDGGAAPLGDVILLSAEDGIADTIRPRLDALGADVRRVHIVQPTARNPRGDERMVSLARDVALLEQLVVSTGAALIVVDPVSAYLGETDSHKDSEVRGVLAPLAALAERTESAILGVMHLGKASQRSAIYRPLGSIAFVAAARIVLAVARDHERQGRCIVAPIKSNLSAPPAALAYSLANGLLVWEPDPVSQADVDALLSPPLEDRRERQEAAAWLRETLAKGRMSSREIQQVGYQAGHSWRTLRRAAKQLGIEPERVGGLGKSGRWYWGLPTASEPPKSARHSEVATLASNPVNAADSTGVPLEAATSTRVATLPQGAEADSALAGDAAGEDADEREAIQAEGEDVAKF